MNTFTLQTDLTLVTEVCCNCSVMFAMPSDLQARAKTSGRDFYCPNGHGQHYTKTVEQELKEKLAKAQEDSKYWMSRKEDVQDQLDHTSRRLAAQKGQTTKLKNRISKGVCPCCNRSFQNLHRHMSSKHPDFTADNGDL